MRRGEISHVEKRTDTRGRKQPAKKKPEKLNIEKQLEALLYCSALEQVIIKLPKEPPKDWTDKQYRTAQGYTKIILIRLDHIQKRIDKIRERLKLFNVK